MSTVEQTSAEKRLKYLGFVICALGALFYCYEFFLRIAPSVVTSEIRALFQIDATTFGYLMAFYYWAYTPMQLPVGLLMDRYGPRKLLSMASFVCGIGVLFYMNPNHQLSLAQLGRFLIGFGSAFAFVGALKLATLWLPSNRFAMFAGIVTTLGMLGAIFGDVVSVKLFEYYDWQDLFIISGWVGIGLAIVIFMVVRDKKPRLPGMSYHRQGKKRPASLKHIFKEFLKLLNNRQVWINGMIGSCLYLSLSGFAELWGIDYFQTAFGLNKVQAGWANAMVFLGWAVGAPLIGWASDRFKLRRLFLLIGSALAAFLMFIVLLSEALNHYTLYLLMFGVGIGSSAEVLVFAVARDLFAKQLAGSAIALTNMMVMLSGMIVQPLVGALLDMHWVTHRTFENGMRIYTQADFNAAIIVVPLGFCFALALSLFLKESCRR